MEELKSKKSSQNNDYAYLKRCLSYADTNQRIALHLLAVYEGAGIEIALHIFRAWHGVALAAAKGESFPAGDTAKLLSKVAKMGFAAPKDFSSQEWKKDIATFAGEELLQQQLSGELRPLDSSRLRQHCEYLGSVIKQLSRQLDNDFGVESFGKRVLRHWPKWSLILLVLFIIFMAFSLLKEEGPWRVTYYQGINLSGKPLRVTTAESVDFDWLRSDVPSNVPDDNFSMRWVSCLKLDKAEKLNFDLASDDGSRLLIDGKKVIDAWEPQAFLSHRASVNLTPGMHRIQIDYFEQAGNAALRLKAGSSKKLSMNFLNKWLRLPSDLKGKPVCLEN